MTVILFLAILCFLVFVHELGHFAVAKWVGMRVDEFGIGFPPRIWSFQRGETVYSVNALPVGGFVKIYGEDGEESAHTNGATPAPRSFLSKSRWAQSAVLVAGVSMNVLCGWLLIAGALLLGVSAPVMESEATPYATLRITDVLEGGPADRSGIPRGATLLDVRAGEDTLYPLTPTTFSAFVADAEDVPLMMTYQIGDEIRVTEVRPETDVIFANPGQRAVGVALSLFETTDVGIGAALYDAAHTTINMLVAITVGLGSLLVDTFQLQADFSDVAGPVGIVGLVGDASSEGLTSLLLFTAFISLNLAIINILPFPALDGGRLLIVAVEAVRQKALPSAFVQTVNTLGFLLLIALMLAVTWNDIARLL